MIRTVTLNPGFDEIAVVSGMHFGGVAELSSVTTQAGGKGFNAARVARALGSPVTAYGLIGARQEDEFARLVRADQVQPRLWPVAEVTRRNLTILPQTSPPMAAHFRSPGLALSHANAIAELGQALVADVAPGDVVTLNGSLPEGAPQDSLLTIGQLAVEQGAAVIVDTYGSPRWVNSVVSFVPQILRKQLIWCHSSREKAESRPHSNS